MDKKPSSPADQIDKCLTVITAALVEAKRQGIPAFALTDMAIALKELRTAFDEWPEQLCQPDDRNDFCKDCAYSENATQLLPYGDQRVALNQRDCSVAHVHQCPAAQAVGFVDPDDIAAQVAPFLRRQAS